MKTTPKNHRSRSARTHLALFAAAAATTAALVTAAPDLIITNLGWFDASVTKLGTVNSITAYSTGTFSCNNGDTLLPWDGFSSNHPIMTQNLYRLEDNRFEQVGMSWAKHSIAVVAQNPSCGDCQHLFEGGFELHPGCMDPYDATTNADQTRIGPRSEVNAAAGTFTFPHASQGITGDAIFKRLQVPNNELDPALHPGAQFVLEAQHVSEADTQSGTALNSVSYRPLSVGAFSAGGFDLPFAGALVQGQPAVFAWAAANPTVVITPVEVPGDGTFYLASTAIDIGGGSWRYEYALLNYNSNRSAQSLSIPAPTDITNIGFHDIDSHSGEPYDTADWSSSVTLGNVEWATTPFANNPNANALRWSTLYNFRFESMAPPTMTTATITLFRPGSPANITAAAVGVESFPMISPADFNSDGVVNSADLALLLGNWGKCPPGLPPCLGDLNGNGFVDASDLAFLLGSWG